MPLTASKTDADTMAAIRLVKNGLVRADNTVSFMVPIHCRTGSGEGAAASVAGIPLSSKVQIAAVRKNFFMERSFGVRPILTSLCGVSMDYGWTIAGLSPDR